MGNRYKKRGEDGTSPLKKTPKTHIHILENSLIKEVLSFFIS